jgi:hypothetical protein
MLIFAINDKHVSSMTKMHTLPLPKNIPTISPFVIDGSPLKNIQLYHCNILEITTPLFSPFDINVKEETCSP